MAMLSIVVPVEAQDASPLPLIAALAAKPDPNIEIVIAADGTDPNAADQLSALSSHDARVRVVLTGTHVASAVSLWSFGVEQARGDWLSLIRPDDIVEPDALAVGEFAKRKLGHVDAIGWNALSISPLAEPGKSASVAIPTKFDIAELDKTEMLKAFYLWEGAGIVPKMPFGLYHGLVTRELAASILASIKASGREHQMPQWEWAARTVLMAEKLVFCSRPLSVINTRPYSPPRDAAPRADFPFHAGIGITAALAEIQSAVFAEMGATWTGSQENFIRSCIYDCMGETDPQRFNDKCNAYFFALKQWEGGQHAALFRPQFVGERPLDLRRGLHGNLLMIDRHIAGARNAQEFYNIIRNFLVPIGLICGSQAA